MVHGDSNIQSIFTKLDEDKQTIEQQIYVNPLKKSATNTKVDIAGSQVDDYGNIKLGNGSTIIDQNTEIKVYKLTLINNCLKVIESMILVNTKM